MRLHLGRYPQCVGYPAHFATVATWGAGMTTGREETPSLGNRSDIERPRPSTSTTASAVQPAKQRQDLTLASHADAQADLRVASSCRRVSGHPSSLQNTSFERRCRCALRTVTSSSLKGTRRSRPDFVGTT
jgi:hypothetical protein